MESLSNIQAQIHHARALSQTSRELLRQINQNDTGLHRSDSFKSTKSEQVYSTNSHIGGDGLPRTNSFTQLNGGAGASPSSPTPSQGSSTKFSFPLSMGAPGGKMGGSPYANVYLPSSKMSASREDDCDY